MSGCDVDLEQDFDNYDDDETRVFNLFERTERDIEAQCIECHAKIDAGAERHVRTYVCKEQFYREDVCLACIEVTSEFRYNTLGGGLWDAMHEQWDDGAHVQACLNRLETVKAKSKLHRQWLDWHDSLVDGAIKWRRYQRRDVGQKGDQP